MLPTRPLKYEKLYDDVFALLGRSTFRPGDRIGIRDLATRLGVSPTPVREVLSRLAGRGIVEERRSEGFYVSRIDGRDAADLYSLHGVCMLRCVALWPMSRLQGLPYEDAWELFALLGSQVGDTALQEVRAYLDDRLKILRSIEKELVADGRGELEHLGHAIRSGSLRDLSRAVRQFHARRRTLSHEIAMALARAPRR